MGNFNFFNKNYFQHFGKIALIWVNGPNQYPNFLTFITHILCYHFSYLIQNRGKKATPPDPSLCAPPEEAKRKLKLEWYHAELVRFPAHLGGMNIIPIEWKVYQWKERLVDKFKNLFGEEEVKELIGIDQIAKDLR